ncbi:glycerate kinase [uncultured Mediterranea sp.]|uniref:glycerate kinase family protein n=1 Tax=uncultured Mediterranea sp. TaxID=1926662 RepID=UPI002589DCB9|nr:glycerate kinase [uncultured Mediterranea sp.]
MRKFVLAIDSFKGSLTSIEAEVAAREGILRVYPRAETLCIPIADGGEGMLDALSTLGGQEIHLRVQGPLNDQVEARYLITADGQTAYIEMASASGLTLVPENLRNPLQTTTRGTGELMRDALDRGCRRLVIGLGGSATNDGGMGMFSALGIRFLDRQWKELEGRGMDMTATVRIDTSLAHPALKTARCTAACDVRNPFDGPQGAAFIFAPQKGATPDDVQLLDQGLHHLAQLYRQTTGIDIATLPGAGAAGGLGGALAAFLHADLRPGISLLLEANGFQDKIKGADLIITGEGRADRQTLMGKVPAGVLNESRQTGIPVVLIAGQIADEEELHAAGFYHVCATTPKDMPLRVAMQKHTAQENIRQAMEQLLKNWNK